METHKQISEMNNTILDMIKKIKDSYAGEPETQVIIQQLSKVSSELNAMLLRKISGNEEAH